MLHFFCSYARGTWVDVYSGWVFSWLVQSPLMKSSREVLLVVPVEPEELFQSAGLALQQSAQAGWTRQQLHGLHRIMSPPSSPKCSLLKGVPLEVTCAAALLASPSTFYRFCQMLPLPTHWLLIVSQVTAFIQWGVYSASIYGLWSVSDLSEWTRDSLCLSLLVSESSSAWSTAPGDHKGWSSTSISYSILMVL